MFKSVPLLITQFLTVAAGFSPIAAMPEVHTQATPELTQQVVQTPEYRRRRETSRRGSGRREMLGANAPVVETFD